ncbi:hypothetical protein Godav_029614 [Gossypium davidsonii]|uniref:Uncharacterized protein n=1 Tax=Gossypium davidsonii TaxID=34287 RepID=A0A7J8TH93_GOSDV|nr:hypothetical protein [Gossypium davidsonii]
MKRSLISLTDLIRGSFWHASTVTFGKLIRFPIGSSLKIIHL